MAHEGKVITPCYLPGQDLVVPTTAMERRGLTFGTKDLVSGVGKAVLRTYVHSDGCG